MIAEELKKRRKKMGLTQKELAEYLGLSAQQINNYERARFQIPKSVELALGSRLPLTARNSSTLLPGEQEVVKKFVTALKMHLKHNVILIVLFGSKVRSDSSTESDIDILIVLKTFSPSVRHKIYDILFEIDPYYDVKISPTILSLNDFQRNDEMNSPFILQIKKEGIWL